MMAERIMVSVNCLTFNHEQYIAKALDGFVMQKTNFKYEVLIHDDASTDGTADIIRKYEKQYPDIIKPIYQKENQYSKGVKITQTYQLPRAKGKYIAFCEGDDYWCDENKLQMQFDALELHPDTAFCAHKVDQINANTLEHIIYIPNEDIPNKQTQEKFIKLSLQKGYPLFQTSSYFMKKSILEEFYSVNPSFKNAIKGVGDLPMLLWCASKSGACYINQVMSVYRYGSKGSFTERTINTSISRIIHIISRITFWNEFNIFSNRKYNKYIKKRINEDNTIILFRYRRAGQKDEKIEEYLKNLKFTSKIRSYFTAQAFWYYEIRIAKFLKKIPFMRKFVDKIKEVKYGRKSD